MGFARYYWQLIQLNPAGGTRIEHVQAAQDFFRQMFPNFLEDESVKDKAVQAKLHHILQGALVAGTFTDQATDEGKLAELCFTCFISRSIRQVCHQLEMLFGKQYGFTKDELLGFVLDGESLSWEAGSAFCHPSFAQSGAPPQERRYRSFSREILQEFNPQRGSLTTWVDRKVRSHRELNDYLIKCGLYLASDWAILNDTTLAQLKRILSTFYALTPIEIERSCALLSTYHSVYRRDRLRQLRQGNQGRCREPTPSQLNQIGQTYTTSIGLNPMPDSTMGLQETLERLQILADQLRKYRVHVKGGPALTESWEHVSETSEVFPQFTRLMSCPVAEEDESRQLSLYVQQFLEYLDSAVAEVFNAYITRLNGKSPDKVNQFLEALYLLHCEGWIMEKIAGHVGLRAQYQVTRLLKPRELRSSIRQKLIQKLYTTVYAEPESNPYASQDPSVDRRNPSYQDPVQLQHLDNQIETLLNQPFEKIISGISGPMDSIKPYALKQVSSGSASSPYSQAYPEQAPQKKPTNLLSYRICHYLDTRDKS